MFPVMLCYVLMEAVLRIIIPIELSFLKDTHFFGGGGGWGGGEGGSLGS